jgi:sugar phosphate isomerase/epimerase
MKFTRCLRGIRQAVENGRTVNLGSLYERLGLNVPYEWWPATSLLKGFEAAGFGWAQIPTPPAEVLARPHDCSVHAHATAAALKTTTLDPIVHAPGSLLAGSPSSDRSLDGLVSYAAEAGAGILVYHARNLPDGQASEDMLLAETRSLARLASRAERLGVVIALENLAPVFPGPEHLSHTPMVLRSLAHRISSPAIGLCLDLGHANIVADLRHASLLELVEPVLDSVALFHLHDNLGARRGGDARPELDPLRLDLHLPPGAGSLPWSEISTMLVSHTAPLLLEVHPPHRGNPAELFAAAIGVLTPEHLATATA